MARAGGFDEFAINDFTGGLNLRDGPDQISTNELRDTWNVSINQRGGIEKRTGFSKWNTSGQPSAKILTAYYSRAIDKILWFCDDKKLYPESSNAAFGASIKTFTTTDAVTFADFAGKCYVLHPVDGLFSYDGTTFSAAIATAPAGVSIATWQNKLWIAGTNSVRLYACAAGDPTTWSTGSGGLTNDVRAKDDTFLKALAASEVEGLSIFKEESTYRVYDSSTGAYQTIDQRFGASNHFAVTSMYGHMYVANKRGIFSTSGASKLVEVSAKISRLFDSPALNETKANLWCAGYSPGKVRFSLTSGAATTNNLVLEYDPRWNAWTAHSCAVSAYVQYGIGDDTLLGAAPAVNGQAYKLYDTVGTDDGLAIASRIVTAFARPTNGGRFRLRQLVLRGRGAFTLSRIINSGLDSDLAYSINTTGSTGGVWDTSLWDDAAAIWGPTFFEGTQNIYSIGTMNEVAFKIEESGSTTGTMPNMLSTISGATVGYWALYSLRGLYVPLTFY